MPARRRSTGSEGVDRLISQLERMRAEVVRLERGRPLSQFGSRRVSARNLIDYLALRRFDARRLQEGLAGLGLSSLGHAESHVRDNLDRVLRQLYLAAGRAPPVRPRSDSLGLAAGRRLIDRNARRLLGPPRPGRRTRIMVTVPTEAATDPALVRELVRSGMDCMRINCAHDTPATWAAMISNVRRAERGTGRRCRVEMDLCGPRVRIGPMAPGPAVVKVRPRRDALGRVTRPGRLRLVARGAPVLPEEEAIPSAQVPRAWLQRLALGASVALRDARGAKRTLRVVASGRATRLLATSKTVYLSDGTVLRSRSRAGARWDETKASVASRAGAALLRPGDSVHLTAVGALGRAEARDDRGRLLRPATFPVVPPEALAALLPGARVWFDGGRVGGVARAVRPGEVTLEITHARPNGVRLGADKGLNFPDSFLPLPSLTPKDLTDLDFVVARADVVGYSFVQSATDVRALRRELAGRGVAGFPFVLKIETARGFELLPEILLAALRSPDVGVMVARGDLAVEVGYERLAEVQEEILWLAEAAHLPTVWATQVLEELTKTGLPSRAEVTDAAMGASAECVMLNKGPHLLEAVRALDNILRRMEAHQLKKSSRLRHLNVAERFFEATADAHAEGEATRSRKSAGGAKKRAPVTARL